MLILKSLWKLMFYFVPILLHFFTNSYILGDSHAQYRDDLYSYGEDNRSLLYAATEFQITRLVTELLKKKADPNVEVKTINGKKFHSTQISENVVMRRRYVHTQSN